jgi:hypothetical protein
VRAAAKIFFVKSLVIERVLTYSEYSQLQTDCPPLELRSPESDACRQ